MAVLKEIVNLCMPIRNLKATTDDQTLWEAQLFIEEGVSPTVRLQFDKFDSGIINGNHVYQAMQNLHKELDLRGIKLLCNCFRYDVRPSGMSIDMGGGVQAYKLRPGEQAKDLVNIFDSTDDIASIVTFEEQKEYYLKWLNRT